jgi:putative membrane protein
VTEPEAYGSEPAGAAPPPLAVPAAVPVNFANGEWHRLHPATPLFRGGLAFIAIIGVLLVNLRDRLVSVFFGADRGGLPRTGGDFEADAIDYIVREELVVLALLAGVGVLLLLIAGFWLSWRMHTFRITDEVVEVRSGILFRTNRKGRLDRIQGINIGRPIVPRLFGAAKLEITVAGNDANVPLAYLRGRDADALRQEILRLASGSRRDGVEAGIAATGLAVGRVFDARLSELRAPEIDVDLITPQSVVRMNPGRLIGSTVLSDTTVVLVAMLIGLAVTIAVTGEFFLLFAVFPAMIGIGGFLIARITRSLRYSIAATPDGVRVGFGLLSTTNETLPPGRIHSLKISQPLLWRPSGWWQVAVNRASRSSQSGAAGQQQTTILPVGNLDDVRAVVQLLLPNVAVDDALPVLEHGLLGRGNDGGFSISPRRARPLRWFSQPRNGFAVTDAAVLLRTGSIWRSLTIVPLSRAQSVSVYQGPVLRALSLASVHVHTVSGPISASVGALDRDDAMRLFDTVAASTVRAAQTDTSHRWSQQ